MTRVDRRSLLKAGGVTAGAAVLGGTALQAISLRMAEAAPGKGKRRNTSSGYGLLFPTTSLNDGQQWLALPRDFEYTSSRRPAARCPTAGPRRGRTTAWGRSAAPPPA